MSTSDFLLFFFCHFRTTGMNQMSHESHARMKQHHNAQQQQQQQHHLHQQQQQLKAHIKDVNTVAEIENHQNSLLTHVNTTSPNHMHTSSSTPSTTGTSPDLLNYQSLTAPNSLTGVHMNGSCISPKTDHSHHSASSPYGGGHTAHTSNLVALAPNVSMPSSHHATTHLNLNLNTQVVSQQASPSTHHNHGQVMGSSNIYSSIGQPYATDNSSYGPIYHHHNAAAHYHGHAYATPYDKLKVTGHLRQTHSVSNSPLSGNSVTTPSPNSYTMSSYQSFYGSSHQMMRPDGYIGLVPR